MHEVRVVAHLSTRITTNIPKMDYFCADYNFMARPR